MIIKSHNPSSEAVTTYDDGEFTEFYVVTVDPKSRELLSTEFYEKRPDLGEVNRLKQTNSRVIVPEKAKVFVSSAGLLRDRLRMFWTGWKDDVSIHALSIYQETPITVPINSSDLIIQVPITVLSKKMHQYFWRPEGPAWSLFRHVFSGEFRQTGTVVTEKVTSIQHKPVLYAAAPILGPTEDQTVLSWVEPYNNGFIIKTLLLTGTHSKQIVSEPLMGLHPIEKQRLALYVGLEGQAVVSFVAENISGEEYFFVEWFFDSKGKSSGTKTTPIRVAPKSLHSAATFYYKKLIPHKSFVCLLIQEGTLYLWSRGNLHLLRRDVSLSYDFPILTSVSGRYEAQFNQKGELNLVTAD